MTIRAIRENTDIQNISNKKSFNIGTYSVLGMVAAVMTVMNILTDKGFLTVCTGAFAALCIVNIILALISASTARIAKFFFAIEVLCMFTFFLVSGNPDGFSAIWICMLPSLGMIFFDRVRGTILCAAMFLILIFFLWLPFGQQFLQYQYTSTFRMRFPILFVAFHILALFLETLRVHVYNELNQLQKHFEELSVRDQLTGMYNRQGMYSVLEKEGIYKNTKTAGIAMLDIDHFKEVNDRYGHHIGDVVLKAFALTVKENLNTLVCRWGGEEFVVIYPNDSLNLANFERLKKLISEITFSDGKETFTITASIGICRTEEFEAARIDAFVEKADIALYEAKSSGRNKIVFYQENTTDPPK